MEHENETIGPIIIGAHMKSTGKKFKELEIQERITTIQRTTLLNSARKLEKLAKELLVTNDVKIK